MRLFIAVDLPASMREKLGDLISRLRHEVSGPRWVRAEGIHLTLRFLGEVGQEDLSQLQTALSSVADGTGHRFELLVEGLGLFPEDGRPRVLWIGLHGVGDALAALQRRVENVVHDAKLPGVKNEDRPFRPHLTLARLGEGRLSVPIREFVERLRTERLGSFEVRAVTLFESILGPGGARYRSIQEYPL